MWPFNKGSDGLKFKITNKINTYLSDEGRSVINKALRAIDPEASYSYPEVVITFRVKSKQLKHDIGTDYDYIESIVIYQYDFDDHMVIHKEIPISNRYLSNQDSNKVQDTSLSNMVSSIFSKK